MMLSFEFIVAFFITCAVLCLGYIYLLKSKTVISAQELGNILESLCTKNKRVALNVYSFCHVYQVQYDGEDVAVKRVPHALRLDDPKIEREWTIQETLNHVNVLKLRAVGITKDYKYLVMDLCAASMDQLFRLDVDEEKKKCLLENMPSDPLRVLYEIASGVAYIHEKNYIHRDIKPPNILLSNDNPIRIKLADYGHSKATTAETGTCSWTDGFGTEDYRPKEYIQWCLDAEKARLKKERLPQRGRINNKIDVFSTGVVFFYYLSHGLHPFGHGLEVTSNIYEGNQVNINKIPDSVPSGVKQLIQEMIDTNPDARPPMTVVKDRLNTYGDYH